MKSPEQNCIMIHGGGLVEPSKHILLRIGKNLSEVYNKVYIGYYSFEALYTPEYIVEYNDTLIKSVANARGTVFGTCRDINLNEDIESLNKAIKTLKEFGITTIIVAGGDGSARQVKEIYKILKEHGINIIFLVPLTIDGINGSDVIGIREAVNISVKLTEDMVATSLRTHSKGKESCLIITLQGRNRDDILANVLLYLESKGQIENFKILNSAEEDDGTVQTDKKRLLLKAVPATIPYDYEKLVEEAKNTTLPTLILASEGAGFDIDAFEKRIGRKVRNFSIGHVSQSNNMMTHEDATFYDEWIDSACYFVKTSPFESFTVIRNGDHFSKQPADILGKMNPRNLNEVGGAIMIHKLKEAILKRI